MPIAMFDAVKQISQQPVFYSDPLEGV